MHFIRITVIHLTRHHRTYYNQDYNTTSHLCPYNKWDGIECNIIDNCAIICNGSREKESKVKRFGGNQ